MSEEATQIEAVQSVKEAQDSDDDDPVREAAGLPLSTHTPE